MLLIARKKGESVQIGDDVVLTVIEIRQGQIRLGFEAPRWIRIRRAECPPRDNASPTVLEFAIAASAND